MERLLKIILITGLIAGATSCRANEERPDIPYDACPHSSGVGEDRACQVDSFSLIASPQTFCSMRVVTFGYVSITWGALSLYPDAARADAQFIPSAILIADLAAIEQVTRNMDDRGQFVEVIGEFQCRDGGVRGDQFGVGELVNIKRVSLFSASEGAEAKENILYFRP